MAQQARVRVPKSAKSGEVVQVKTLFPHVMETGRRRDRKTNELVPRKIINRFECKYEGKTVFSAELHPAISANPYLSFHVRAGKTGKLEFAWTEDGGAVTTLSETLTVA